MTGCPERLRLLTLLKISARHWFTARWVPAAANDDFGPHPLGAA